MRAAGLLFIAAVSLAGCASKPSADAGANIAQSKDGTSDGSALLGAIADSSLPKGECGMVLWTLEQERPAPIFRYLSGKSAEVTVNGKHLALTRTETKGSSAFGVYEGQTFAGADGLRLAVDVHFSVGFDGGAYLERGLVTVETQDGWRTVAPSAGIAGCRSK